jgi:LAS superfamily LD-carboxypeptidase LdcB
MCKGPNEKLLHPEALEAFFKLHSKAQAEGFDLSIVSGFRSFEDQKSIWQAKARGKKILRNSDGEKLNYDELTREDVLESILRWSAIPGASRHHWGSEIDIIDANALTPGQKVELTPDEVASDGPFGPLHDWLDGEINNQMADGFFRPYEKDLGGVAPERWHLSYRPLSESYLENYSLNVFIENLKSAQLDLEDILLKDPEHYYARFVLNICS